MIRDTGNILIGSYEENSGTFRPTITVVTKLKQELEFVANFEVEDKEELKAILLYLATALNTAHSMQKLENGLWE